MDVVSQDHSGYWWWSAVGFILAYIFVREYVIHIVFKHSPMTHWIQKLNAFYSLSNGQPLQVIFDLCMLKLRTKVATLLSIGLLTKYRGGVHTDLTYFDGAEKYIIRFIKKRGSYPFNKVWDESNIDVTIPVKIFAGPDGIFHGIPTTPKMLGYTSLTFDVVSADANIKYTETDIIKF